MRKLMGATVVDLSERFVPEVQMVVYSTKPFVGTEQDRATACNTATTSNVNSLNSMNLFGGNSNDNAFN